MIHQEMNFLTELTEKVADGWKIRALLTEITITHDIGEIFFFLDRLYS